MTRYLLVLAITLFSFPLMLKSQEGTGVCDNGFGVLKLKKKLSEVKSFLTKADTATLKFYDEPGDRDGFTSCWTVNLKKAKMETYCDQKVTSIEVYFSKTYDAQGKPINDEEIAEFVVYFDEPADARGFRSKLLDLYGPAIPLVLNGSTYAAYSWFGDTTLLDVKFGYDELEKTGIWLAHFSSSVG